MGDYPDYTTVMQIIGSDIMVPIDIQGSYIMMPVDIQAQYVTLDINIVAQTVGNINIDIAAQTVGNIAINLAASAITLDINILTSAITLNVDITAQTIGNLTIDITAQSVGVYLQPDWQTLQGTDKNLYGFGTFGAGTTTLVLSYEVTAPKTFYISQWSINVWATAGIVGRLEFVRNAIVTVISVLGGYSGFAQSFTKPIAVVGGDTIRIRLTHYHSADALCEASVGGYEI